MPLRVPISFERRSASHAFRRMLAAHAMRASMSRRGDVCDNAAMESCFATLKKEPIHDARYATRAEARAAILKYLEVFYNRQRRHSTLGYQSPVDCEQAAVGIPEPRVRETWGTSVRDLCLPCTTCQRVPTNQVSLHGVLRVRECGRRTSIPTGPKTGCWKRSVRNPTSPGDVSPCWRACQRYRAVAETNTM
jgi:hypothetical protein